MSQASARAFTQLLRDWRADKQDALAELIPLVYDALATFDERKARIIELHYFGGLTQPEIATVLELHVNTVARDLRLAQAWIHDHVRGMA